MALWLLIVWIATVTVSCCASRLALFVGVVVGGGLSDAHRGRGEALQRPPSVLQEAAATRSRLSRPAPNLVGEGCARASGRLGHGAWLGHWTIANGRDLAGRHACPRR